MATPLEVHLLAEHNLVAVWGGLLIQVRNGPMNETIYGRIEQTARSFLTRQTKAMGMIAVLEPGAPPVPAQLRERQREVIRAFTTGERLQMCTVVLGSGVIVFMQRAFSRGLAKLSSKIFIASSVPEAARWMLKMLPGIGSDERTLCAVIEEARAKLHDHEPPVPMSTRAFVK